MGCYNQRAEIPGWILLLSFLRQQIKRQRAERLSPTIYDQHR